MSLAPPPANQTWPPQPPYPPVPQKPRRRWPAVAAAAGAGAIVAGIITTLITFAATSPAPTTTAAPSTVTKTAQPPPPPAPMPVAEADTQTCRAWATTDKFVTAGAAAIPIGVDITDPAVQSNPAWKAAFTRAGDLFSQAADTFQAQIAPGTNPMLTGVAATTVSSLRALSEAYKAFDPELDGSIAVFQASQRAVDRLCR